MNTLAKYSTLSKEALIQTIGELEARIATLSSSIAVTTKKTKEKARKKPRKEFDYNAHTYRKVCLKIAYFGWDYDGFASQESTENTVERHLFEALEKTKLIKDRNSADYSRCGRTDKGVSALCQIVALKLRSNLDKGAEFEYTSWLNKVLPSDIRVLSWCHVKDDFSARFSCTSRKYKYFFFGQGLNLEKMQQAAELLEGSHDFRNFSKIDPSKGVDQSFERNILSAKIESVNGTLFKDCTDKANEDLYVFSLHGSAFLWHQVRCIMAILFYVGQELEPVNIVSDLLDLKKYPRKPQYEFAAPHPLVLWDCVFPEDELKMTQGIDAANIQHIIKTVKQHYRDEMIKCTIMKGLFDSVIPGIGSFDQDNAEVKHIPLSKRGTCATIEERAKF